MASSAPSQRSGALPAGTFTYEVRHDPVPGVADAGVPIRAKVTVDPKNGLITVDVRDNPDCVPGGLNVTRSLRDRILPYRRVLQYRLHRSPQSWQCQPHPVLLRDNCVVGRPQHPIGTSCATSNVNERLANAVQCCFTRWANLTAWPKAAAISRQRSAWSPAWTSAGRMQSPISPN